MDTVKASKLLKELKGSKFLPYYNEELIKELKKDIKGHCDSFIKIISEPEDENDSKQDKYQKYMTNIKTLQLIIYRYKRIILAYLSKRMDIIEQYVWEFGQNLPKEYKEFLHPDEKQYTENYRSLIVNYSKNMTQNYPDVNFDLTKDLEPPHDTFIEVRVLQDCGEILTSYGEAIKLSKDTQHYVKRQEVEHLILQGYLKPIEN
ncbi:hypothetical protein ABPG72_002112 [Tetrahymena utriculariae]